MIIIEKQLERNLKRLTSNSQFSFKILFKLDFKTVNYDPIKLYLNYLLKKLSMIKLSFILITFPIKRIFKCEDILKNVSLKILKMVKYNTYNYV